MSTMGEHLAICLLAEDGRVLYRDADLEEVLGVSIRIGDELSDRAPWLMKVSADEAAVFVEGAVEVVVTPTSLPGVAAVVRARRQAPTASLENELRAARHTLTSILDAAPISILVLDMEKKVTLWNAAATRMFGWTAEEVLGAEYPLVPEGEGRFFDKLFDRVIRGEGFTGVEARRARKDGSSIDLRIHTAPIRDADGAVIAAMAILEDLSEQRRLEGQVLHSQKMEAVGRLASGVAHDFNNLLAVILGISEVLMAKEELNPRVSRGLQEITECGDRARDLTKQLLAFSRRQVLHPEVVDMSEQVRATASLITRLIGEQIEMSLDLSSEPLLVRVDTGQFDQVLINLAVNARDAMKDGGKLLVTTWLDEDGDGDHAIEAGRHAVLDVRDTGPGIAASVLPQIFDPFFTTKRAGHGTGLGLATVHGIVEQSGGSIRVLNELGRGATFSVRLPVLPPEKKPTSGSSSGLLSKLPSGTEAVLLVEDDPQVRTVASTMLRRLGYDVTVAHDGRDALLHFAKGLDVAVVITDVAMPRMGGRALSAELRMSHPGLPLIFVSANLGDGELRAEVDSGRARFLQKPFSLSALAHELRSVLDG